MLKDSQVMVIDRWTGKQIWQSIRYRISRADFALQDIICNDTLLVSKRVSVFGIAVVTSLTAASAMRFASLANRARRDIRGQSRSSK